MKDKATLETDIEILQAAVDRISDEAVRNVLRLLGDGEISTSKAHEWIREFVKDGRRGTLPEVARGIALKELMERRCCHGTPADVCLMDKCDMGEMCDEIRRQAAQIEALKAAVEAQRQEIERLRALLASTVSAEPKP